MAANRGSLKGKLDEEVKEASNGGENNIQESEFVGRKSEDRRTSTAE